MMATTLPQIAATPIGQIVRREPVRVGPDTLLGEVVSQLRERGRGAVIVEDQTGLVGIFSERDLMLRVDHGDPSWPSRPVRELMTRAPRTIRDDQEIEKALNLMLTGRHRHLPIVDGNDALLGIVSIRDLLIHIVGFFPDEFLNLPPDPEREARGPWGG
jgi:CBS domain-containing protein